MGSYGCIGPIWAHRVSLCVQLRTTRGHVSPLAGCTAPQEFRNVKASLYRTLRAVVHSCGLEESLLSVRNCWVSLLFDPVILLSVLQLFPHIPQCLGFWMCPGGCGWIWMCLQIRGCGCSRRVRCSSSFLAAGSKPGLACLSQGAT